MVHGLVPDLGLVRKTSKDPTRAGSSLQPIQLRAETSSIKTKLQNSILHQGVKVFNSLPQHIRDVPADLYTFKKELDCFHKTVPDQPAIPGFVPGSKDLWGKPFNSIIDSIRTENLSYEYDDLIRNEDGPDADDIYQNDDLICSQDTILTP